MSIRTIRHFSGPASSLIATKTVCFCFSVAAARCQEELALTVGVDGAVAVGVAGHSCGQPLRLLLEFGEDAPSHPQQLAPRTGGDGPLGAAIGGRPYLVVAKHGVLVGRNAVQGQVRLGSRLVEPPVVIVVFSPRANILCAREKVL